MRKFVILFCFVVLALAGITAALPLLVSSETVRVAIVERLTALTGREVSFRGNPSVLFSPFLAIEISDLVISDQNESSAENALLVVDKVQAQLEILPAFVGDVSLDKFRLLRPRLNLQVNPDGTSSWKFEKGQLFEAFDGAARSVANEENAGPTSNTRLGSFEIVDGAVQYEDTISGNVLEVTSMNGVLTWPQTDSALRVEGQAIWRGESVSIDSRLARPMRLMAGGETAVSMIIESTPVNLTFAGTANMLSDLFINGKLELSTPSTTRLSEILETRIGNFGSLSLSGDIEATAKIMRVTDASIEVSDNAAEGALSISFDEVGDSKIDGTLAFEDLDFSSLFNEPQTQSEGQINPIERNTRIDLRVSANTINAGFTQLGQVAAIVTSDENGWTVDIGDSEAFGGSLIAKFGATLVDGKQQAFLESSGTNLNADQLSSIFAENRIKFSGDANFNMNLRAKDLMSLMERRGVSGSFDAGLKNGSIVGIDLPGLLTSLKTGEDEQPEQTIPLGITNVEEFEISLFVTNSVANIGKSSMLAQDTRIQLLGSVDVRQGNLALRAQEVTSEGPEPERLFLGGTLKEPLISLKRIKKTENQAQSGQSETRIWN